MRDLYLIRCLCVFSVWLFSLGVAFGQQIDTTAYHELSGVEVVEKVRPSVTREGTPLQIMDRAGIDRLGVQDLSEAVKRFSGVTVQDCVVCRSSPYRFRQSYLRRQRLL